MPTIGSVLCQFATVPLNAQPKLTVPDTPLFDAEKLKLSSSDGIITQMEGDELLPYVTLIEPQQV